jgi:3-oxoacyl-[acyl-carrier protein] reductase
MRSKLSFVITGTSRGIGCALAKHFLDRGHVVFGCSTGSASITHPAYMHFSLDLSSHQEVMGFVKFVRKNSQYVDVLINNAAINPLIVPAVLLPSDTMQRVFNVNVITPMILCREMIKLMKKNNFGRIINMGSMATRHEVVGEALYTSSKAAMVSYTRVLSKEVFQFGITANVVAPSVVKTELSDRINQEALRDILQRNAIQSFGNMIDITNIIDFLVDENSNSFTGQLLYLGGV